MLCSYNNKGTTHKVKTATKKTRRNKINLEKMFSNFLDLRQFYTLKNY